MAETKNCPYCGEEILAVAKKCKHCGEWLDGSHQNEEVKPSVSSPKVEVKPQQPTVAPNKPKKNNPIIYGIIGLVVVVVIVLALTLSGSNGSSAKKIYVTDLERKTETTTDPLMGTSSFEYFYDKNGNKFEGEAWLKSDLECITFGNGFPMMCSFYYPNGQLAVCDATDAEGNRSYYDSNGNKISPEEFREVYVKQYGSKLDNLSNLEDMIEKNSSQGNGRSEQKEIVYVDENGNSWYVDENGDTLMVEN